MAGASLSEADPGGWGYLFTTHHGREANGGYEAKSEGSSEHDW